MRHTFSPLSGSVDRKVTMFISSGMLAVNSPSRSKNPRALLYGYTRYPASTAGPTGYSRYSRDVHTPKFPPPPRSPHSRSAFSSSLAVTARPSAVTTSAEIRLSQLSPCLPDNQPMPPPSVSPAIPVSGSVPPGAASPNACVS